MPRKKTEPDSQPAEAVQPEPEVSRAVPEAQADPPPPEQPVRRRVSEDILQLTEEEVGLTAEDSEDVKWGYLAGAARRGQILTGVVSAAIVSFTGLIGFVGLVTPHIVRMFIGADNRYLVPACALFGAALMLIADIIGRVIIAPSSLPVGVVMSFIGGPVFLWMVLRRNSSAW